jgi:hypothetical protein
MTMIVYRNGIIAADGRLNSQLGTKVTSTGCHLLPFSAQRADFCFSTDMTLQADDTVQKGSDNAKPSAPYSGC